MFIVNEKWKEINEKIGGKFLLIVVAFFMLQVGTLLGQYVFHVSNIAINITLGFVTIFSYLLLKDGGSDGDRQFGVKIIQFSTILTSVSFINHFFIKMVEEIGIKDGVSTLFQLGYLLSIFIGFAIFAYFQKDSTKELMITIRDQSIYERLKGGKGEEELNVGDVELCVNKDTQKRVIWRFKDRFLHMLILGPTGSGKTSQTILPLINQDMQNKEGGITVLEPKGDLAEKVYAMAEHYGRKAVYFNPILPDCPYFNPLFGKEDEVIENMATTFKMLNPGSPQFFLDQNEMLIRQALKVLKRLYGNKANLIELSRLIHNSDGQGRKMVQAFGRVPAETAEIAKENADVAAWFLNDYLNEKSKTYEHCSGLRSQVAKITSNKYLRRVLNPPSGENDVDFDKHLEEGGVITISTAQGALRDLGKFLGYFLILQFQSSVFKRPGNEFTRRAHFLYIDEFQTYSNPGFADMLTQGRSYRVASHIATQNRALIGMNSGSDAKNFVELVSTNARNVVIYPGANPEDAKYYSELFGQEMQKTTQVGITRQKFNPLKGIKPMNYDSESIKEVEKLEYRFAPTDIRYRPFGEIVYSLIDNNTTAIPGVGIISYIPRDLNDKLDDMVAEYNEGQFSKGEHASPNSAMELVLEEADEIVPVISKEVISKVKVEKEDMRKRNRDVVDASNEYMDEVVMKENYSREDMGMDRESAASDWSHEKKDDTVVDDLMMDDFDELI